MENMKTKVGYIKGLIDGLGLDESKKEGRVLMQIAELLDQMTDTIMEMDDSYDDLMDYVEAIDEDLTELEDDFYEEEDEYADDFYDEFDGGFTFECPSCREMVCIDEDAIDEGENLEILCPECSELILIDDWDSADLELDDGEDIPFEEIVVEENKEDEKKKDKKDKKKKKK